MPLPQHKIVKEGFKKSTTRLLNIKVEDNTYEVVKQAAKPDSPPILEPVVRSEFIKRIVTHRMTTTLAIADYNTMNNTNTTLGKKSSLGSPLKTNEPEIEYLPRARDIDNPKARGGSI
jgi:hypothetical protein